MVSVEKNVDDSFQNFRRKESEKIETVAEENAPMVADVPTPAVKPMTPGVFIYLLVLNTIDSTIAYGCLPSLSTYALLPFGQKAFYYWSVLTPIAYPLALLTSLYWKTASNANLMFQSIVNLILSVFIFVVAAQSPCPWLADSTAGALMIISVWFLMSFVSAFLRISIGNRIKIEWRNEQGMFYYGATAQLGLFFGTIPTYLLINVFEVFVDRQPCQSYCLT